MKVLITSGGTQIPIDSVRHIGNMSSGKFGSDLAQALLLEGHEVIFFRHRHSKNPAALTLDLREDIQRQLARVEQIISKLNNYTEHLFTTYDDYARDLPKLIKATRPQIIVASAAVSDYGVVPFNGKISSAGEQNLVLRPLAKVLPSLKAVYPKAKIVGFKLLAHPTPQEMKKAALKTLNSGHCELVAANDIDKIRQGKRGYKLYYKSGKIAHLKPSKNLAKSFVKVLSSL